MTSPSSPVPDASPVVLIAPDDVRPRWRDALAAAGLAVVAAYGDAAAPPLVVQVGADDAAGDDALRFPAGLDPQHAVRQVAWAARLHRRLHAERAARHREAGLDATMIAVLTHDLRTPLTAVTLSAEIVEKRSTNESVLAAARRIKASVMRMSETLGHLLHVAGQRGEAVAIVPAPGDLAATVGQATAALAAAVTVETHGETQATFDAAHLGPAVATLVRLATEGRGEHGGAAPATVEIDGAHRAYVRLRISTPAVLDIATQAALFSEASSPGAPAPGVGPALEGVEDAVRAHGGTLVGHCDPAVGTVFEIMLPHPDVPPFDALAATAAAGRG